MKQFEYQLIERNQWYSDRGNEKNLYDKVLFFLWYISYGSRILMRLPYGLLWFSLLFLVFPYICIKIISCFPSPCTGLSPAQTTTEAPLPCRIFIGLYLIALRRSDLGNPRLRYNNMAMIDCRIWLPPVTAYCGCAVICSCLYYTTLATEVLRYSELSYLSL